MNRSCCPCVIWGLRAQARRAVEGGWLSLTNDQECCPFELPSFEIPLKLVQGMLPKPHVNLQDIDFFVNIGAAVTISMSCLGL